ncbi:MAG: amidohydrolase [Symbiobacteriaceae bacterium]|nr:amidohydrolase [Symbiobacteriaceae bacterium]
MPNLVAAAQALQDKLITYRRDFHQYPESGWTEFRTGSLLAKRLAALGYQVLIGEECQVAEERMGLPSASELEKHYQRALEQGAVPEYAALMQGGLTAVVGILECGPGPVLGMRFDFDAVDVQESATFRPGREGFNSVNPNVMHSCGHDCHATVGLGVAELLMSHKDQLKGTVKLVFQPAEEGVRGAKSIVASGILDDVDYMLAGHVSSGAPLGYLHTGRNGMLATTKLDAIFTGAPAHAGGTPHGGKNALLAAATAVLNLQAIPRHSEGATRINVGRLNAGTGRNVIPDKAHLALETRGATSALNQHVYDYAIRVLSSAAAMHDCGLQILPMGAAQGGVSDPAFMEIVSRVATELGCFHHIDNNPSDGGGSEDYTYMMERVQQKGGLATFVGYGGKLHTTQGEESGGHHTAEFDVDEGCLAPSVALFAAIALDILK